MVQLFRKKTRVLPGLRNTQKDRVELARGDIKGKKYIEKINQTLMKEAVEQRRKDPKSNYNSKNPRIVAFLKKRYFTTVPVEDGYKRLSAKAFAQKNEQLMALRKRTLAKMGVTGAKAEKILYLFRLRKAASIIGNTRGFVTLDVAKKFHDFIKANKAQVTRNFGNEASAADFFLRSFKASIENQTVDHEIINNPLNEMFVEEVVKAEYAIRPEIKASSRVVSCNHFPYMAMYEILDKMIREELGEKYSTFSSTVREAKKGL